MSRLWYRQPAGEWEEALPLGNGRLGAMVYGGVDRECIQVNEESVWYGGPVNRGNPDAREALPRVRQLLREGKPREAEKLMDLAFAGCPDSMHPYQTLGEIQFYFDGINGKAADTIGRFRKSFDMEGVEGYERSLSLDEAACRVGFQDRETKHSREFFISKPADCLLMRFCAAGPEKLSFYVRLKREKSFDGVEKLGNDGILLHGNLGRGGSEFAMALRASAKGGSVRVLGETLCVEDAEEAVLYFTADTTWHEKFHNQEFLKEKLQNRINSAMKKTWEELLEEHKADYSGLYDRFMFSLEGEEAYEDEPTDARLAAVREGRRDLGLDRLLMDYGRYLMISCSRPGGLPATLQGLWNTSMTPPWDSKYTVNINTEMNYWMAESCALPECHLPLFDLISRMRDNGRVTAREMYGCRGFVCHHNTDINGDTVPQDIWHAGSYWVMGAAWLCTHLWTHYQYTLDRAFLEKAFPVMAEAALFFVDFLTGEGGYLATNPSVSPENTYILPDGSKGCACIGASMDNQILRELFGDVLSAWEVLEDQGQILDSQGQMEGEQSQALEGRTPGSPASAKYHIEGVEDISELMEEISHCMSRLRPDQISPRYGTLQEWAEDYEEAEPGHRHISHLFALYPGTQITVDQTPELAAAARKTLEKRLANGGGHTGWSRAWIISFWAALWDGEKAYENIQKLLEISTYPNLFDRHPPFQIDGNFGVCAGICNMLVQCRDSSVVLLPALPKAWESGSVRGLRLIGNASLDMRWEKGVLKEAVIRAGSDYQTEIIYRGRKISVQVKKGESARIW
ncbi:MAG: glycoside hydrolase family 95 protein [Lachnospiraceae bacterium]|nr:glycoside hydrolase family 95 protein [Lachnospiraceae bacterium]